MRKLDAETIDLIVIYESGSPGMETWITYFPTVPLCKGSVAAEISSSVRYIPTGQLKGLIPGMRGAAEYEKLVDRPGIATQAPHGRSEPVSHPGSSTNRSWQRCLLRVQEKIRLMAAKGGREK
ncbi:MAG: hypothetical protein ACOX4B_03020 [Bacillota bacterium]